MGPIIPSKTATGPFNVLMAGLDDQTTVRGAQAYFSHHVDWISIQHLAAIMAYQRNKRRFINLVELYTLKIHIFTCNFKIVNLLGTSKHQVHPLLYHLLSVRLGLDQKRKNWSRGP